MSLYERITEQGQREIVMGLKWIWAIKGSYGGPWFPTSWKDMAEEKKQNKKKKHPYFRLLTKEKSISMLGFQM